LDGFVGSMSDIGSASSEDDMGSDAGDCTKLGSLCELSQHLDGMQSAIKKKQLIKAPSCVAKTQMMVLCLVVCGIWRSRKHWLRLCRGKGTRKAVWTAIALAVSSLGSHPKIVERAQSTMREIIPWKNNGCFDVAEYSKSGIWQCIWTAVWIDFVSSELFAGGKDLSFCMQFMRI